jgi:hypothetical protein
VSLVEVVGCYSESSDGGRLRGGMENPPNDEAHSLLPKRRTQRVGDILRLSLTDYFPLIYI